MANPFWSQELQDRFALEQARPEDLPLVPEGDSGVGGVGESEEMIPDARDLLNLLSFDADQENVEEKSLDDGGCQSVLVRIWRKAHKNFGETLKKSSKKPSISNRAGLRLGMIQAHGVLLVLQRHQQAG